MRDNNCYSDTFGMLVPPETDPAESRASIWDNNMNSTTYGHLKVPEPGDQDTAQMQYWDEFVFG